MMESASVSESANSNKDRHILDVAGGKGECAVRLAMCHQVQVVLVDPRPASLADCFSKEVLPRLPKKWQARLLGKDDPDFIETTIDTRCQQLVMTFTTHDLESSLDLQQAVQNASLLVGLHADGATEAIVDAALQYKKPFCVVPCCVFPNLFVNRMIYCPITNRQIPVRSPDQFCQYLLQKHEEFQMTTLPFDGRNIAIYWNPKV